MRLTWQGWVNKANMVQGKGGVNKVNVTCECIKKQKGQGKG